MPKMPEQPAGIYDPAMETAVELPGLEGENTTHNPQMLAQAF
jgi:hypothetical protein